MAKHAFPAEEYAIILGIKTEDGNFEVKDLYYPEDRLDGSTPESIDIDEKWFEQAQEDGFRRGLIVLGDVHTHCYDEAREGVAENAPSAVDYDWLAHAKFNLAHYYSIMGILRVVKRKKTGRFSCDLMLYPAMIPFEVVS